MCICSKVRKSLPTRQRPSIRSSSGPSVESLPDPSVSSDPPNVAPSLGRTSVTTLSPDAPPRGTDNASLADALVLHSDIDVALREVASARLNYSSSKAAHAAAEAVVHAAHIALQAAMATEALARMRIHEVEDRLDHAWRNYNSLVSPDFLFVFFSDLLVAD